MSQSEGNTGTPKAVTTDVQRDASGEAHLPCANLLSPDSQLNLVQQSSRHEPPADDERHDHKLATSADDASLQLDLFESDVQTQQLQLQPATVPLPTIARALHYQTRRQAWRGRNLQEAAASAAAAAATINDESDCDCDDSSDDSSARPVASKVEAAGVRRWRRRNSDPVWDVTYPHVVAASSTAQNSRLQLQQQVQNRRQQLIQLITAPPASSLMMKQEEEVVVVTQAEETLEECLVCYCEYAPRDFQTLQCGHRYCHTCMREHISTCVNDGRVTRIACMSPECTRQLLRREVLDGCDAALLERYDRFLGIAKAKQDPRTRWCPNADCSAPVCMPLDDEDTAVEQKKKQKKRSKEDRMRLECERCHTTFCGKCSQEHDTHMSCSKARRARNGKRLERQARSWARWHSKKCPKCGERIEKNGGCHHMSCTRCSAYFCWECGKLLNGGRHCIGRRIRNGVALGLSVPLIVAAAVPVGIGVLSYIVYRNTQYAQNKRNARYRAGYRARKQGVLKKIGDAAMYQLGVMLG